MNMAMITHCCNRPTFWLGQSRFLRAESLIIGLRLQEDTNSVLNTTEYVCARIQERILTTVYPSCIQEKLYPYRIYTVLEKWGYNACVKTYLVDCIFTVLFMFWNTIEYKQDTNGIRLDTILRENDPTFTWKQPRTPLHYGIFISFTPRLSSWNHLDRTARRAMRGAPARFQGVALPECVRRGPQRQCEVRFKSCNRGREV